MDAFLVFFETDISLGHPVVGFNIFRIAVETYLAVLDNFAVVVEFQVDGCSVAVQFGFEFRRFGVEIDRFCVLFVGIFHVVGAIGSLLDSCVGLFLHHRSLTLSPSAKTSGSSSSTMVWSAARCGLAYISWGSSLRKRGCPLR